MAKTMPISEVKTRLPELVSGVEEREDELVAREFPNCESTTVPATGCTSKKLEVKCSFCSQEETSVLRTRI